MYTCLDVLEMNEEMRDCKVQYKVGGGENDVKL